MVLAVVQAFGQGTVKYEYDALNHLTQVTYSNGVTVSYTYDALGNRLSKKVTGSLVAISGDLNDDGIVDVFDLALIKRAAIDGDWDNFEAADLNADSEIDEEDVKLHAQFVHGILTKFPASE